jgi:hypothetical protein
MFPEPSASNQSSFTSTGMSGEFLVPEPSQIVAHYIAGPERLPIIFGKHYAPWRFSVLSCRSQQQIEKFRVIHAKPFSTFGNHVFGHG